jgi:hypothetical protein
MIMIMINAARLILSPWHHLLDYSQAKTSHMHFSYQIPEAKHRTLQNPTFGQTMVTFRD